MKRTLTMLIKITFLFSAAVLHGQSLYWDTNGATAGAGTVADGTWDAVTTNWTTDSTGASATGTYVAGSDVVFSAGSDVSTANITLSGTQQVASLLFKEGDITLNGTPISGSVSPIQITVNSGASASLNFDTSVNANFNIEGTFFADTIRGGASMSKTGGGTATFNRLDASLTIGGGKIIYTGVKGAKLKNTTINAGTLEITGNAFDGTGRSLSVNTGGTFEMGAGISQTVGSLSGGGTLIGNTGSTLTVGGTRTFNGDVTGELNLNTTGTLTLSDTSSMEFTVGGDGVNNMLSGTGAMNLNGIFSFNLGSADLSQGNSWMVVDVGNLNETFGGTFSVVDFTESSGVWTNNSNSDLIFEESTGTLSVIPEPSSLILVSLGVAAGIWLTRKRKS